MHRCEDEGGLAQKTISDISVQGQALEVSTEPAICALLRRGRRRRALLRSGTTLVQAQFAEPLEQRSSEARCVRASRTHG
jgi:hypothetical protein